MRVRGLAMGMMMAALAACQPTAGTVPPGPDARGAVDWPGGYQGTLPCADCEGIRTTLRLTETGHFTLTETYLGQTAKPFVTEGRFTRDGLGSTITLGAGGAGDPPRRFLIGEGKLWHLDGEGQVITGDLADLYILTKVD